MEAQKTDADHIVDHEINLFFKVDLSKENIDDKFEMKIFQKNGDEETILKIFTGNLATNLLAGILQLIVTSEKISKHYKDLINIPGSCDISTGQQVNIAKANQAIMADQLRNMNIIIPEKCPFHL